MKYFPLKTVLFCILVVPLLFTGTLTSLEQYLNKRYEHKIQNLIFSQTDQLLNGKISIYNSVAKDIRWLLETDILVKTFNLRPYIRVKTKEGKCIYSRCSIDGRTSVKQDILWGEDETVHQVQTSEQKQISKKPQSSNLSDSQRDKEQLNNIAIVESNDSDFAQQNKSIMDIGLEIQVVMAIRENSLVSNLSLFIYISLSLSIFGFFYNKAISKFIKDDMRRGETISNLVKDEQEYIEKLETLKKERELLAEKLTEAKVYYQEERRIASIAEEELFDEIVQLEKKLEENISLQQEKEDEIEDLKNQLEKVERRKGSVKKRKSVDVIQKRFGNIYKNIEMNRRAIAGLIDLDEDMQIKAEEVIHQLNEDPLGVTVKRKVFAGKKNKTASFEVLFAYNGRLYFRNLEGNRVEILVIGTKNTQDKDMEFLHYI
ncbi:MAG: hypothetical protein HQK65_14895 [Desulfamplus sp.]|nr:hypothetical protein [Desulfamplus sp.]